MHFKFEFMELRGALSELLFNLPLEYAVGSVQKNKQGLKWNEPRELLVALMALIYWVKT